MSIMKNLTAAFTMASALLLSQGGCRQEAEQPRPVGPVGLVMVDPSTGAVTWAGGAMGSTMKSIGAQNVLWSEVEGGKADVGATEAGCQLLWTEISDDFRHAASGLPSGKDLRVCRFVGTEAGNVPVPVFRDEDMKVNYSCMIGANSLFIYHIAQAENTLTAEALQQIRDSGGFAVVRTSAPAP